MSAAPVLGSMTAEAKPRRCEHTGLSIPECCCRHCCEALLRRYAPWLLRRDPEPASALWTLGDFAEQRGGSTTQLHERARREEVST